MIWLWIILSIFGSLIVIGVTALISVFVISKTGPKEGLEPNLPEVDNYLTQFTDGYGSGLEISCIPLKNGDSLCSFYPTDQEQKRYSENKSPGIKPLIVGRGARIVLERGEKSSRRARIIYNVKNPQDLPEKILKTPLGKFLSQQAIVNKVMNDVNKSQVEAGKASTYIMQNYGLTPMVKETLIKLEDIQRARDTLEGKEKDKSKETKEKPITQPK